MSKDTPDQNKKPGLWFLLAIGAAVALFVLAFSIWNPSGGGGGPTTPTPDRPKTPADLEAMAAELSELGELFGQVMEHRRDAGPLLERFDKFNGAYPDIAPAYTLRGQVLMYAGREQEAIESFKRSLTIEPGQAEVHQLAGTLAMRTGHYDAALNHYEQAARIEPGDSRHAVFLANAQLKLGEDEQAVQTLLDAIRRDSHLHGAYALLSDIYASRGKLDLAQAQIGRALDTAPKDNPGLLTVYTLKRASLLRRVNKPAESLALLNALPTEAWVKPEVLQDTAASWAMLDKPALAAQMYERVLAVDPASDFAAAEAARWWLKAGDAEAAKRNLQALRRINPRHEAINEIDEALRAVGED